MEIAARRGHILPGPSPEDQVLAGEGQIFLSSIYFFGIKLFSVAQTPLELHHGN